MVVRRGIVHRRLRTRSERSGVQALASNLDRIAFGCPSGALPLPIVAGRARPPTGYHPSPFLRLPPSVFVLLHSNLELQHILQRHFILITHRTARQLYMDDRFGPSGGVHGGRSIPSCFSNRAGSMLRSYLAAALVRFVTELLLASNIDTHARTGSNWAGRTALLAGRNDGGSSATMSCGGQVPEKR